MMSDRELREQIVNRWVKLRLEREPFLAQWHQISEHITPASGRFLTPAVGRKNQARERWNRIYDNTAVRAANILAAGLMSGMTDPSSQWFSLTTGSPDLDESHAVKVWLDQVQRIMEMCFTRTNVYQALHHGWREVGCYGVTAMVVLEDQRYGLHCYPLVVGEYAIGVDFRGIPDTLYRKFSMTAAQLVQSYGRKRMPQNVLNCYDTKDYDKTFRCLHAIEPRFERDPTKADNLNMPWRSVVIVLDAGDSDGVVDESGYNEFPAVVGRWGASASDIYSEESPGMVALGDTLQLQHEQLQKGNAIDYQVNPPRILPTEARDNEIDFLPGGISFINMPTSAAQVQSAFNVGLNLQYLSQDILEVQQRINQAFNVDMFLMIASSTNPQMTATEAAERHEEKLMMLGPVLSRLNNEVLRSLIERTFSILMRTRQLPPPPPELQGVMLNVEYTSMLARSQRAIRANSMDQFLNRVMQVAQVKPEVTTKINGFNVVDEYADYFSVSPSVIVPNDEAQAQVQAQQEAAREQQQAEQMAQGADVLAKLGRVPAGGETMAGQAVAGMAEAAAAQ